LWTDPDFLCEIVRVERCTVKATFTTSTPTPSSDAGVRGGSGSGSGGGGGGGGGVGGGGVGGVGDVRMAANTLYLNRGLAVVLNAVQTISGPCGEDLCEGVAQCSADLVRCAFSDRNLHSRMPLVPTPARFKRRRVANGIPLGWSLLLQGCTVNCVQTLKVQLLEWMVKQSNTTRSCLRSVEV
jgi:hypothetical protein